MTKPIVYKKRGGPYEARPRGDAKEAWFYTNAGSITIVIRQPDHATLQADIPLRVLKKIVRAME